MLFLSKLVIGLIMVAAAAGCLASIFCKKSPLGEEFLKGVGTLGTLLIPVAGVMASMPFLCTFVLKVLGPFFSFFGADPAMAASTLIASDMGGYQLSAAVSHDTNAQIVALFNGLMAGATLVFSFPLALKIVPRTDHNALAKGMLFGFISIPFGVAISAISASLFSIPVRTGLETVTTKTQPFTMSFTALALDLLPLCIVCILFAFLLIVFPRGTVKGFSLFGRILEGVLSLVFVLSVIEYFTHIFPVWPFDPIMADAEDQNRALEMCGYIALMLSGAYPLVYLMQKYLSRPLERLGRRLGFSSLAMTGMLATLANSIALFSLVSQMEEKDKVRTIAFSVGASFLIGDHLAFMAVWQPTLIIPMVLGKAVSGIIAIIFANIYLRHQP